DLVSLTPTSLDPGGTLEAQIDVTNTSSEPVSELELELRTRTARVTDREALTERQSDTSAQPRGDALAASDPPEDPAPGEPGRRADRRDHRLVGARLRARARAAPPHRPGHGPRGAHRVAVRHQRAAPG